ncbi:MAG: hypothetical protein ACKOVB_07780 [Terrabacter sp.]
MTAPRLLLAGGVLLAVVAGGGAGWALSSGGAAEPTTSTSAPGSSESSDPMAAARTELPGVTPAQGEPRLAGLRSADPEPGTVGAVPGPFDDRFDWSSLRLDGDAVRGSLTVTSDVSDLLELQVLAGFYDDRGRFLGTARWTYHLDESEHGSGHDHAGPPDEHRDVVVRAPARFRDRVASAAVGVPVLVNE